MSLDYLIALIAAVALMLYLIIVLANPEDYT